MAHHGPQETSYETELWEQRIQVVMNDYKNFTENQLPYLAIPGKYSEYLRRMIKDLYFKTKQSLESIKDPGLSNEVALVLSGTTRYNVSRVWHTVLDLTQTTVDTPKDLYFFTDSIYERLGGEEVPYFIKVSLTDLVPGTINICKYVLQPFLINLGDAFEYLSNKKAYVIFATPSIMQNPVDWALLIHEAAHILEEEKLKIVSNYYPQLGSELYVSAHNLAATSSFPVDEAMPNWALEIACDIISTISCGPIFGYRLLSNFLREEKSLYETHPPIKKRLELISNELNRFGWKEEARDIRAKIDRVNVKDFIERAALPEHCNEIIDAIRKKAKAEKIEYRCTPRLRKLIKMLGDRLNSLKPCITIKGEDVDLKDLLNASLYVKNELTENNEFKGFMADMIRLITAKDIYKKYESGSAH
ncbi:MAG TPA: hypothetical protein VK487_00555 [Candidatus Bathyarchaeia archaeon]|nr:hypothetical protein [Candidatus Bathyarchaeia archaeon]